MTSTAPGTLTLLGSGELTEAMAKVHRLVMARIAGPVRAVFLDTPAGFELNADEISERAVSYFAKHFALPLTVVTYKSASRATECETALACSRLQHANYLFAGPGSPTYTVRHWKNTPVFDALVSRFQNGAHLVFASAATIALGRFALPVYEIYKVGADPFWAEGLDLFGRLGLDLAVIPHWNNAEGGTYDTRYCWMGAPRLALLENALPDSTVILGVDEWTACVVDPAAQECLVVGAGQVTIRHDNHEHVFPAGTQFGLDQLHASALSDARESAKPIVLPQEAESVSATRFLRQLVEYDARALTSQEVAGLIGRVCELATALERAQASGVPGELIDAGRGKMRALLDIVGARLGTTGARGDLAPLMDLLIHTRMKLRAAKQYALADEIRDELARLNVVLEDTPQGTTWRKK